MLFHFLLDPELLYQIRIQAKVPDPCGSATVIFTPNFLHETNLNGPPIDMLKYFRTLPLLRYSYQVRFFYSAAELKFVLS